MPIEPAHVLLVEDEEAHAELVCEAFESRQQTHRLTVVDNLAGARAFLAQARPALVLVDLVLPDGRGTELIPSDPDSAEFPVVVMTSHGDEQIAVDAMKAGALDYVVKSDFTFADMPRIVERALREWKHIIERKRAEAEAQEATALGARIGLLSRREHEVMDLVVSGKSNKVVAQQLFIAGRTVEKHRANVMKKLHADNLVDLVRIALAANRTQTNG